MTGVQTCALPIYFVALVEDWEAEAEKIGQTARTNQEQAANMIVTTCTPALTQAAAAGDTLAARLQSEQAKVIERQNTISIAFPAVFIYRNPAGPYNDRPGCGI